jgi:hypothetical protein
MTCRSQSSAYKSALTDRFTDSPKPKQFDLHQNQPFSCCALQDPATHTRHLYLLPRKCNVYVDGRTVVRCELLSHAFGHTPPCLGLSYTWGDPTLRLLIAIGDRILSVTENLAVSLEHLQEEELTLVLWVDAVCIDQDNQDEKNIQVQRMGDIFSSAALVIAWLGVSADESDLAMEELEKYAETISTVDDLRQSDGQLFATLPLEPIKALFDRSWFKRVWVGQEVALNSGVIFVCGQKDMLRNRLLKAHLSFASSMMSWKGSWGVPHHARLTRVDCLPLAELFNSTNTSFHLRCGKQLESSDPRDFVYSSFGRISDLEETGLRTDYLKSVVDVYTEFAEAIIRVGRIAWLSRCWRPSSKYQELPSWVPDWSNTSAEFIPSYQCETPDTAVEIQSTERGKVLLLHARRIDQIDQIEYSRHKLNHDASNATLSVPALFLQQQEDEALRFLELLQQTINQNFEALDAQEANRIAFEMSIATSLTRIYQSAPDIETMYYSYQAFRGFVRPFENIPDPQAWRQDASRDYLNAFQAVKVKHLFVTSTGIVGLSRNEVLPGDWTCRLEGVGRIWILRAEEEGCYRIVSSACTLPRDFSDANTPAEIFAIC